MLESNGFKIIKTKNFQKSFGHVCYKKNNIKNKYSKYFRKKNFYKPSFNLIKDKEKLKVSKKTKKVFVFGLIYFRK